MVPRALTIAGSDSGGGAGIQADLKAFAAAGCHGTSAIVALTAQNTTGVTAVHEVPPDVVRGQLEAVFVDIGVDAAKTGMLFSARTIEAVADFLAEHPVPLVVDPVMVASSGARLLEEEAVETLVARLFPLATVITPNLIEAQALVPSNSLLLSRAELATSRSRSSGTRAGRRTAQAARTRRRWRRSSLVAWPSRKRRAARRRRPRARWHRGSPSSVRATGRST